MRKTERKSILENKEQDLYREEVVTHTKNGPYPAVRATFQALTDREKEELFRLCQDLGFKKQQVIGALENFNRNTIILLVFNKERTKVIGTAQIGLHREFGVANQNLGISRLGTVGLQYAFVEESFRGIHLGKELLRLRMELLRDDYFHKWIKQSPVERLKLNEQKIDGKKVSKAALLRATRKENIILVCDLKDENEHFGRVAEAAFNAGMDITRTSIENMTAYAQMSVLQNDDYLLLYAYTGVPVNSVGGRQILSRKNTIQPVYFYGQKQLRERIVEQISQQLFASGAQ